MKAQRVEIRRKNGGGIANNEGQIFVFQSTINGNMARDGSSHGRGGGVLNFTIATLINSTVSNNVAGDSGGGIYDEGIFTLSNGTVAFNQAANGAGIGNHGDRILIVSNSILHNPGSGGNCNRQLFSAGHNLDSDNTCGLDVAVDFGPGDILNVDPLLGPLQDNGGPTFTHALQTGSSPVDAGDPSGCIDGQSGELLTTDQRGRVAAS